MSDLGDRIRNDWPVGDIVCDDDEMIVAGHMTATLVLMAVESCETQPEPHWHGYWHDPSVHTQAVKDSGPDAVTLYLRLLTERARQFEVSRHAIETAFRPGRTATPAQTPADESGAPGAGPAGES